MRRARATATRPEGGVVPVRNEREPARRSPRNGVSRNVSPGGYSCEGFASERRKARTSESAGEACGGPLVAGSEDSSSRRESPARPADVNPPARPADVNPPARPVNRVGMKGAGALPEPGRSKHRKSERSERRGAQRGPGPKRAGGFQGGAGGVCVVQERPEAFGVLATMIESLSEHHPNRRAKSY